MAMSFGGDISTCRLGCRSTGTATDPGIWLLWLRNFIQGRADPSDQDWSRRIGNADL